MHCSLLHKNRGMSNHRWRVEKRGFFTARRRRSSFEGHNSLENSFKNLKKFTDLHWRLLKWLPFLIFLNLQKRSPPEYKGATMRSREWLKLGEASIAQNLQKMWHFSIPWPADRSNRSNRSNRSDVFLISARPLKRPAAGFGAVRPCSTSLGPRRACIRLCCKL